MTSVTIKCDDKMIFEKVKTLIEVWGDGEIQSANAESCTIRCILPEKKYKYIKRKWNIGVIVS